MLGGEVREFEYLGDQISALVPHRRALWRLIAVIAICRRRRLFILIAIPFGGVCFFFFPRWVFLAIESEGHLSRLNAVSIKVRKLCREVDWLGFKMDGELCAELGVQGAGLGSGERFTSRSVSPPW